MNFRNLLFWLYLYTFTVTLGVRGYSSDTLRCLNLDEEFELTFRSESLREHCPTDVRASYECPTPRECPLKTNSYPDGRPIICARRNEDWYCRSAFTADLVIDQVDVQCESPSANLTSWINEDTCRLKYTTRVPEVLLRSWSVQQGYVSQKEYEETQQLNNAIAKLFGLLGAR